MDRRRAIHISPRLLAIWGLLFLGGVTGCSDEQEIPAAAAHVVAAKQAMEDGDRETALRELDKSITIEPSAWAYAMRARLHAEASNDDAARADCEAGLQLDANNEELQWIAQQLKAPSANRFQQAQPPSSK